MEMIMNWKNVIRDPALGYSDVSCSNVIALLFGQVRLEDTLHRMKSTHLQHPPKTREIVVAQSYSNDKTMSSSRFTYRRFMSVNKGIRL